MFEKIFKVFLVFSLVLQISIASVIVVLVFRSGSEKVVIGYSSPSLEMFAKKHKFHGIEWSFRVGNEWYFIRDGKRCRLFVENKKLNRG